MAMNMVFKHGFSGTKVTRFPGTKVTRFSGTKVTLLQLNIAMENGHL